MRLTRSSALWVLVSILGPVILQGGLQIWASPQPLSMNGDHAFFLSDIKQLILGQGLWKSSITGYPYGQDTAYFPTFEPLYRLVLWCISRFETDVFTAVKVFYVLGIGAMGYASYCCLRALSIKPALAACGAIAFTLTPYFQVRALNHDMLSIYLPAAFGSTFALMIASFGDITEIKQLIRRPMFIVGMVVISTCGLYYAMFSLLLMGFSVLSLSIRTLSVRPLMIFACISTLVMAILLVAALGPNLPGLLASAPKRMPVEQFWHGISISDALSAFDWIPWVHQHAEHYLSTRGSTLVGEGYNEWPGPILTLAILASPLIVLVGAQRNDVGPRPIIMASVLICFILLFAGRAGFGYLLNELVTPALRAQARFMPLLVFLAIFIVMSTAQMAISSSRTAVRAIALLMIGATLASAWTVSGVLSQRQRELTERADLQWILATFRRLNAVKDASGLTAILQIPVVNWPETPFRNGYTFYAMRYGFVLDRVDSKTKWSYGVSDQQPGYAKLSEAFKIGFDPNGLVQRARSFGYDGILVEHGPLTSDELKSVLQGINATLPLSCRVFEDNLRTMYDIGRAEPCRAAK